MEFFVLLQVKFPFARELVKWLGESLCVVAGDEGTYVVLKFSTFLMDL